MRRLIVLLVVGIAVATALVNPMHISLESMVVGSLSALTLFLVTRHAFRLWRRAVMVKRAKERWHGRYYDIPGVDYDPCNSWGYRNATMRADSDVSEDRSGEPAPEAADPQGAGGQ